MSGPSLSVCQAPMTLSPLQKRIIELSLKVVSTDDVREFNRIASELKSALREHAESLGPVVDETKKRLAKKPRRDGTRTRSRSSWSEGP